MTEPSVHHGNGAEPAPAPNLSAAEPASSFYEFTPTGLIVAPDVDFAEWSQIWHGLDQTSRSINWLIGDALVYGEDHFAEHWSQVLEPQYVEQHTTALWVARKIPPPERHPELSWSTHRTTARLTKAQRAKVLDLAISDGWDSKRTGEEVAQRYPDETRKKRKKSTYPRNDPTPSPEPEAEPLPAVERWPEPPPPIEMLPEPPHAERPFEVRRPDSAGNVARPDQDAIDAVEAAKPKPLPSNPEELFKPRVPPQDQLRAMLDRLTDIVAHASLPDDAIGLGGAGWRLQVLAAKDDLFSVELRRGNQLAVGLNRYLPLAMSEAAIGALISDLETP